MDGEGVKGGGHQHTSKNQVLILPYTIVLKHIDKKAKITVFFDDVKIFLMKWDQVYMDHFQVFLSRDVVLDRESKSKTKKVKTRRGHHVGGRGERRVVLVVEEEDRRACGVT